MGNHRVREQALPGASEGARRATGDVPGSAVAGGLGPGERWTATRKREVVLRLLRGEALNALSRELGVEIYRLEQWRERALVGIDTSLMARQSDPLQRELDSALKRIGELSMENELLHERCRRQEQSPLASRRSQR